MAVTKLIASRVSGQGLHDWTEDLTNKGVDSLMESFNKKQIDTLASTFESSFENLSNTISTAVPTFENPFDGRTCPAY